MPKQNAKLQSNNRSPQFSSLQRQKNLVRGSISRSKSAVIFKDISETMGILRYDLNKNFLDARALLDPSEYEKYFEWVYSFLYRVVKPYFTQPIGFSYLKGIIKSPHNINLYRELIWISLHIKNEADKINKYRSYILDAEQATVNDDYEYAIEFIDAAHNEVGHTFHGIQLRLALENLKGGLNNQKTYLEELRNKFRHGILSFVAYYTSVRNEDRISLGRYEQLIDDVLKKAKYRQDTKNYLRYRLTSEWPDNIQYCANIIKVEQSHSIIDVYETLISYLQNIISRGKLVSDIVVFDKILNNLKDINDFRLEKIKNSIGRYDSKFDLYRDYIVSDHILNGNLVKAYSSYRITKKTYSTDPWSAIYAAFIVAHKTHQKYNKTRDTMTTIDLISSVFRRDENCISNLNALVKKTQNLGGFPFYRGVYTFSYSMFSGNTSSYFNVGFVGLNSSFIGVEDFRFISSAIQERYEKIFDTDRPSHRLWKSMFFDDTNEQITSAENVFRAIKLENKLMYQQALELISNIYDKIDSIVLKNLASWINLSCSIAIADKSKIINIIAHEVTENELAFNFLPIRQALEGFTWNDFKPHSNDLSAAIVLDALWRGSDDDNVVTMLRHAFAYQLKNSPAQRPSEFVDYPTYYDTKKLIYYFRYVCIPSRMDMSRAFKSSKDVMLERQNVCASLKSIDPDRSDDYENEIYQITNRSVIMEGMKLIDNSRIHVDIDAISRWSRKNVQEDYLRYKDLVRDNIGNDGNFDEIIRQIFADIGARQVFYTPDNQADAVLTDILARLRDEFLLNSDYGLDYFLSKRVRHQSFIGLIRGPLEFENIITSRSSEFGPYQDNEFWLNRMKNLNGDQVKDMNARFSDFSDSFDQKLIKLKDERLQIKSSEKPSGIFEIILTSRMLVVLRGVVEAGTSFDDFLRATYLVFWSALEPSLAEARRVIGDELKLEIPALFDKFREEMRSLAEDNPAFPELSTTINKVSTEVQRGLDAASGWFVKPESDPSRQNFTLEQCIDIAVASASKSHRAFSPQVEINVKGNISLQTPDLLVLTDTIFIALDNVKLHSGIKYNPHISIECSVSDEKDNIDLIVRNEIHSSVISNHIEEKLQIIRSSIEQRRFGKAARKEGGSGFLKIASALYHSAGGKLEFGFKSDNEFILNVQLKPTRYTVTVISGSSI